MNFVLIVLVLIFLCMTGVAVHGLLLVLTGTYVGLFYVFVGAFFAAIMLRLLMAVK